MQELLEKQAFLFDVEGVLCDSIDIETCFPIVPNFINSLKDRDIKIAIVTNISRKPKKIAKDLLETT